MWHYINSKLTPISSKHPLAYWGSNLVFYIVLTVYTLMTALRYTGIHSTLRMMCLWIAFVADVIVTSILTWIVLEFWKDRQAK